MVFYTGFELLWIFHRFQKKKLPISTDSVTKTLFNPQKIREKLDFSLNTGFPLISDPELATSILATPTLAMSMLATPIY